MQSQNIQVFVRSRPLELTEKEVVDVVEESQKVVVLDKSISKSYSFDQVFSAETQQEVVYDVVVGPLIKEVLSGFNCTVFAYGQTGTGKTYTMEGERSNDNTTWEEDPHLGIIPRAISHLFDELKNYDQGCSVRVSFLELYNEDTYDLLSPLHDTTKLKIFEDANKKGSVIVGGLEELVVKSKGEIYEILKRGSAKRQTAFTLLNACSSRSHTVFCITVHIKDRIFEGGELFKTGKLNLVDLAGSENIGRSGAQDKRAREAGSINQSLLTLGRVITALVEKRPHIPYRESKLTRLLQDSLGGKTKTSIIATISPASNDIENTLGTLEYASHARRIINRPESNQGISQKTDLMREIMEKHTMELNQLEINVRNEVAAEFKREVEKMKQSYQQSSDEMAILLENKDKEIDNLINSNKDLEEKLSSTEKLLVKIKSDLENKDKEIDKLMYSKKDLDDKLSATESSVNQFKTDLALQDKEKLSLMKTIEEFKNKLRSNEELIDTLKLEIQNKNNLVEESKKEADKIKQTYHESCANRNKEMENLIDQINILKTKLNASQVRDNDLFKQMKNMEQLAEYRKDLVDQLTSELKVTKSENLILKEEIRNLNENNKQEDQLPAAKKANKVRRKNDVLEESNDYANMTFDGGDDEILQVSAKKPRKTIGPVKRRRAINEAITLSGKKKKLNNPKDIITEVSPIAAGPTTRSTRSRTTRRKLDFE